MEILVFAVLGGFVAGLLTTVAGIGGGIALVALLSLLLPPQQVIALTAPVFFMGNLTRVWLFRREIDRTIIGWFWFGAIPASAGGALLLTSLSGRLVQIVISLTLLSFVASRLRPGLRPPAGVMLPKPLFSLIGGVYGVVSALAGGAGVVSAPFLYSSGLVKGGFIGTSAAGAFVTNATKTLTFIGSGLLTAALLPASLLASLAIMLGSIAGKGILDQISVPAFERMLLATLTLIALHLLMS